MSLGSLDDSIHKKLVQRWRWWDIKADRSLKYIPGLSILERYFQIYWESICLYACHDLMEEVWRRSIFLRREKSLLSSVLYHCPLTQLQTQGLVIDNFLNKRVTEILENRIPFLRA